MLFGFSTGSLALGDFREGLRMATLAGVRAIELSALRETELMPLLDALDSLYDELKGFDYVSFHAPSSRKVISERELTTLLMRVAKRGWSIVVHPDIVEDFSLWRKLGSAICLENMDKRKRLGQTVSHFQQLFGLLPDARLCFDIGHAMQIDSTMLEAEKFLRHFVDRLAQVHLSYVNSQCGHERLNFEAVEAFRCVAAHINCRIPIILETPVSSASAGEELRMADSIWDEECVRPDAARELQTNKLCT